MNSKSKNKLSLSVYELALFSLFGALMFLSDVLMDVLPNIHLVGMFVVLFTAAYRAKALIPIYVYVFLSGIYGGFTFWWIPYLYVWAVLWAAAMLIPANISRKRAVIVYPVVCSLHGFLFGTLYAPFQALAFSLNFRQTLIWISAGAWFDVLHGISNFCAGFLIVPLLRILKKTVKSFQ